MEWVEPFAFSVEMAFVSKKKMFSRLIKSLVDKITYKMIAVKS